MTTVYRLREEFETERCRLRRALPSDAEAIFDAYAADPEVTRYLGWRPHPSVAVTRAFLEGLQAEWETGKGFPLVIFRREDPARLLGMIHPRRTATGTKYGYVSRRDAWGRGCASEILGWLVEHALAQPAIFRAAAFCDVDHPASARVMQKAGMMKEGILRRYFVHPNISDEPRDCLIYAKVC